MAMASGDVRSDTSSRGCKVHHVRGRLLSMEDAYTTLAQKVPQLNIIGQKMLNTLENMKNHDLQLVQQEFPISYLQHVTDRSSMEDICNWGSFRIINETSRPEFRRLSFWSAGVASEDMEVARERSYDNIRGLISPWEDRIYKETIKGQFANSPAFDPSASRYGNFKFSFSLFSLLDLYRGQHCRGEEPQLRILGTDMYKQEIVHYIVVHGPDESNRFSDLPMVPTVRGDESLPFVYRRNGTFFWRPESTSSVMKVKICAKGIVPKECPHQCEYFFLNGFCCHIKNDRYEIWSAWNHLVFAFYIPDNLCLQVSKGQLLKNLTACSIGDPPLIEESKCLEEEDAEKVIQQMKRDFRKRMRTFY